MKKPLPKFVRWGVIAALIIINIILLAGIIRDCSPEAPQRENKNQIINKSV